MARDYHSSCAASVSSDPEEGGGGSKLTTEETCEDNEGTADIAREETRWVRCSKGLVIAVLLVATVLCAVGVYYYTVGEEQRDFEHQVSQMTRNFLIVGGGQRFCLVYETFTHTYRKNSRLTHVRYVQFHDYAHELQQVSQIAATNNFATVNSMTTTITTFAMFANETWPFVTIPNFEYLGKELLDLSGAAYVGIIPFVSSSNKLRWENYSVQNQGWIQQGDDRTEPGVNATPIIPFIFRANANSTGILPETRPPNPYYGPLWQIAPSTIAPSLVNYNAFDVESFRNLYQTMVVTKQAVLSEVINGQTLNVSDPAHWPQSYLAAPIFKDAASGSRSDLVGSLVAVLPWHTYFENVLPGGNGGLLAVMHDSFNQTVTYRIDGPKVTFLGLGDLHDPYFTNFQMEVEFTYASRGSAVATSLCNYYMSVYPTAQFRNSFRTLRPTIHALGVVVIFVVTAGVFLLYDIFVQRRQTKVMTTALKTSAIVSSLFPAMVRDRLMESDAKNKGRREQANKRTSILPAGRASDGKPVNGDEHDRSIDTLPNSRGITLLGHSKPIADLYPNATVLFGDIAGFTA